MKSSLTTRIFHLNILFLFVFSAGWGCAEGQANVDRGEVLNDIAKTIIIPAYERFLNSSQDLHLSIIELCTIRSGYGRQDIVDNPDGVRPLLHGSSIVDGDLVKANVENLLNASITIPIEQLRFEYV